MAWQLKAGKWVWKQRKPIYRTTRRFLSARSAKKAADRYKGMRTKSVKTKSSGDQDTSRTGRSQAWRPTQGRSALSSKRTSGQYIRRSRMTKTSRSGGRTRNAPYCWRHKRRHFCKYTRKR